MRKDLASFYLETYIYYSFSMLENLSDFQEFTFLNLDQ